MGTCFTVRALLEKNSLQFKFSLTIFQLEVLGLIGEILIYSVSVKIKNSIF